jgi:D-psicose/D-tagatose/L-ribulose 3-epimerase
MRILYTGMRNFSKLLFEACVTLFAYPVMRFGLNSFLYCSAFTDSEFAVLENFRRCGAEVAELAIVDPSSVKPTKLRAALTEVGLERPVVCGAFGAGRDLRGVDSQRTSTVDYISDLIDLASQLDARVVCGPMYSETGRANAYSDVEREQQLMQISEALKPLCEKAEAQDVFLAIEPLNRFETDCINTIEQALDLINRVGSPALKIHIDTFHMNIEEKDSAAAIRHAGRHIGHVHASASHRGLLGQDQVDWPAILGALDEIDYNGDIVIESFSKDNDVLAKATSIWRTLYESPDQLAIEGLAFLQEQWKQIIRSACQPA